MKGAVYLGESEVEVRDFAKPVPGPGEVLVQMKSAGLCGSDLHKYHSSREWAEERQGMIAGHEPAGIVAEAGQGVNNVSVGDRVSVYHSLGCGHCAYCLSGEPVFCAHEGAFGRTQHGCHADFMLAPARHCLPLPEEFSFDVGAMLACTACTAFAAIHKLPVRAAEVVAVFGLGPVGLTALLMAQALGCRGVGVDVSAYRLDVARRLGGETLVNARESDAVESIMELTEGRGADGVVECSGSAVARTQTVAAAATRAHIIMVGWGADEMTLAQSELLGKELTIRGNAVFSMRAYFETVEFLQRHRVPLDEMITHRFAIEQAAKAFALFDSGNTGKVVFSWP
ncbi:MAG: alcohol dehydrogenase catalytic domain-containing protein [Armatimonadota bacterium]